MSTVVSFSPPGSISAFRGNYLGTSPKTPVFGMVQRKGNVKAKIVENVKMKTLEREIVSNVKLGATLYSDELMSYSKIGSLCPHFAVSHSHGEYCRNKEIHSNTIEGFWALFKRGYYGIYYSMSKKHLQRYVDEFVYRYNFREAKNLEAVSDILLRASNTGHLSFNALIS
jgi:transposase-like protein